MATIAPLSSTNTGGAQGYAAKQQPQPSFLKRAFQCLFSGSQPKCIKTLKIEVAAAGQAKQRAAEEHREARVQLSHLNKEYNELAESRYQADKDKDFMSYVAADIEMNKVYQRMSHAGDALMLAYVNHEASSKKERVLQKQLARAEKQS